MNDKLHICTMCKTEFIPTMRFSVSGRNLVGALVLTVLAAILLGVIGLLIGVVFGLRMAMRAEAKTCPSCQSRDTIPVWTPRGQEIYATKKKPNLFNQKDPLLSPVPIVGQPTNLNDSPVFLDATLSIPIEPVKPQSQPDSIPVFRAPDIPMEKPKRLE